MADIAAEAEAFLQSMQGEIEAQQAYPPADPSSNPSAADLIAQAQAAAASFNAQLTGHAQQQNGVHQPEFQATPPQADGAQQAEDSAAEGRRKRRNRWGNPSGAEGAEPATAAAPADGTPEPTDGTGKRKRRSRWEEPEPSTDLSVASNVPKELVLPGGIKVRGCLANIPLFGANFCKCRDVLKLMNPSGI